MDLKLIYISFFASFFGCYAQNDSLQNPYFKSYGDKIIASVYYLDTSNSFQIQAPLTDGEKIYVDLIPNRKDQIGFSLNYKFIDITIGFSPEFLPGNVESSGSKNFNFNTRFYHKKWMQSLTFINQKGFYIDDESIKAPLPDMRTTKIGGTTAYIFNDKFSFKTLINQNEWQTKSSGSFIPILSYYYTHLNLNTSPDSSDGDMYTLSLAPSYFYNFVISDRILIGAGVGFGIGINDLDKNTSVLYELDVNLKLAYNTDRFFAFASLNSLNYLRKEKDHTELNDNISTLKFSIGYRFNTPKKVQEAYEKIDKKIGL
ncbi:DUF4421 domain-containing protein [Flavobacterium zhairuonense]|uniref:DUF4421 family protein n=1 Tax=Flavobacterium zhairuonense TaxID=2493631 RepID=UPI00104DD94F|nr:DUF4421 family protein [Flavobacterium zhairuonense]KAF2515495.1 DUF4421 domain-containing protein [Flavobacterium zhairuonense]